MSRVDVIVPCYNYGRYLRRCVESVLSQPVDLRVLIIDDASSDETPHVAAEVADEDRRVEIRRHSTNQGALKTYNEGIEWASGEYYQVLSADDLLTENALKRAADILDSNPQVGFAYGKCISFTNKPPIVAAESFLSIDWRLEDYELFLRRSCEIGHTGIAACTVVVRTKLQKSVGGYREDLLHSGDTEMWLRLAFHCPVAYIDAPQGCMLAHPQSMSASWDALFTLRQQMAAFDVHFAEHVDTTARLGDLRSTVAKANAQEALWIAHGAIETGDLALCDQMLDYAVETHPRTQHSLEFLKIRWKRRMGTKLWSRMRPMIRAVRRLSTQWRKASASSVPATPEKPSSEVSFRDRLWLKSPEE